MPNTDDLTPDLILGLRKCDAAERMVAIPGTVRTPTWMELERRGLTKSTPGTGLRLTASGREVLDQITARDKAQTEFERKAAVLREAAQLVTSYGATYPGMSDEPERIRVQLEGLAAHIEELR